MTGSDSHNAFRITPDGIITQIIDSNGGGAADILDSTTDIASDESGIVFVTGFWSHNAFRIELCDTLADHAVFADCMMGPGTVIPATCSCPDDDADRDVDLADFAVLQRMIVGP